MAVTLSQSDTKALKPSPNTAPAVLQSNTPEPSADNTTADYVTQHAHRSALYPGLILTPSEVNASIRNTRV